MNLNKVTLWFRPVRHWLQTYFVALNQTVRLWHPLTWQVYVCILHKTSPHQSCSAQRDARDISQPRSRASCFYFYTKKLFLSRGRTSVLLHSRLQRRQYKKLWATTAPSTSVSFSAPPSCQCAIAQRGSPQLWDQWHDKGAWKLPQRPTSTSLPLWPRSHDTEPEISSW